MIEVEIWWVVPGFYKRDPLTQLDCASKHYSADSLIAFNFSLDSKKQSCQSQFLKLFSTFSSIKLMRKLSQTWTATVSC